MVQLLRTWIWGLSYVSTEVGFLKSSLKGWQAMTSAITPRS